MLSLKEHINPLSAHERDSLPWYYAKTTFHVKPIETPKDPLQSISRTLPVLVDTVGGHRISPFTNSFPSSYPPTSPNMSSNPDTKKQHAGASAVSASQTQTQAHDLRGLGSWADEYDRKLLRIPSNAQMLMHLRASVSCDMDIPRAHQQTSAMHQPLERYLNERNTCPVQERLYAESRH